MDAHSTRDHALAERQEEQSSLMRGVAHAALPSLFAWIALGYLVLLLR